MPTSILARLYWIIFALTSSLSTEFAQPPQFGKPPMNAQSLGTMTSTSSSMTSSLPESDRKF